MVCRRRASAGDGVARLELEDVADDDARRGDDVTLSPRRTRAFGVCIFSSASSAASARRSW